MEIKVLGKVVVPVRIENLEDIFRVQSGTIPENQVRSVEIPDAVVDTGATFLPLPRRIIKQLGLRLRKPRSAPTAAGVLCFGIYEPVRLSVQDRDCLVEVAELPDDWPVLIGQVPLEFLDFVVDPSGQRLIGDLARGAQQMIDLF